MALRSSIEREEQILIGLKISLMVNFQVIETLMRHVTIVTYMIVVLVRV